MSERRRHLVIEINRCKTNLKTITDPERRAIIKEHLTYLKKWHKTEIDEAMENSVYIPENVMPDLNTMYKDEY
jgi:chorismate mutase